MSNFVESASNSKSLGKKSKSEPFVRTVDEVDLLLSVVLEYKVAGTSENVDWETSTVSFSRERCPVWQSSHTKKMNLANLFIDPNLNPNNV